MVAAVTEARNELALCMIVRDEEAVIGRCLHSVRKHVDSWVVVDTGSTDKTKAIVEHALAGLPGVLADRLWEDFSTNRNHALDIAENIAAYVLVIDADDQLVAEPGFQWPTLTEPAYRVRVEHGPIVHDRVHVFRPDSGVRYVGAVHELLPFQADACPLIEGVRIRIGRDGARSRDPLKYRRDAEMLEAELRQHPDNPRTAFYLAQSYFDAQMPHEALAAYERRVRMDPSRCFAEETWFSHLRIAGLHNAIFRDASRMVASYLHAFALRPTRAESLVFCAMALRERGMRTAAYPFAKAGASIPFPSRDVLFINHEVYAWKAWDEYAVACCAMGFWAEAIGSMETILAGDAMPPHERTRVEANLAMARKQWEAGR